MLSASAGWEEGGLYLYFIFSYILGSKMELFKKGMVLPYQLCVRRNHAEG